jgi:hypothetical protein
MQYCSRLTVFVPTCVCAAAGKGASSGVGFAIPIDTVKGLVGQVGCFVCCVVFGQGGGDKCNGSSCIMQRTACIVRCDCETT